MTQRDSGQDFDPKHRIIGAIVVVTLAVIFIPMILDEREASFDPTGSSASAPPQTEDETKVVITRVGGGPARDPVSAAAKEPPTTRAPAPRKAEQASAPSPAAAKARPASTEGWVVQVGTFSNAANATRLEQKLRADGEAVLSERITLAGGGAVRLRVGPFSERAAAVKAQERIQRDLGVKGVVLAYP